jgi:hypothetical protein
MSTSLFPSETHEASNNLHTIEIQPKYTFFEPQFDKHKVQESLGMINISAGIAILFHKYDYEIRNFMLYRVYGGGGPCHDSGVWWQPICEAESKKPCIHRLSMKINFQFTMFKPLILGFLGYEIYTNIKKFNEGRRPHYCQAIEQMDSAKELHKKLMVFNKTKIEIEKLQKTISPLKKTAYITITETVDRTTPELNYWTSCI